MKVLAVIPARWSSSRFPGKPLALINGIPMINMVWKKVIKAKSINNSIVATDDKRIFDACKKMSINVIMTSKKHLTGTDRVHEVSKKIKSELTFVGIKSSTIEKFDKTAEALFFTVKFVSEIISVKKDTNNKVIEGDPDKIKTVIDHWKFTKKISSSSPNWYLAEIKNS